MSVLQDSETASCGRASGHQLEASSGDFLPVFSSAVEVCSHRSFPDLRCLLFRRQVVAIVSSGGRWKMEHRCCPRALFSSVSFSRCSLLVLYDGHALFFCLCAPPYSSYSCVSHLSLPPLPPSSSSTLIVSLPEGIDRHFAAAAAAVNFVPVLSCVPDLLAAVAYIHV